MCWWIAGLMALALALALGWLIYEICTAPVHDEDRDGPWHPPIK